MKIKKQSGFTVVEALLIILVLAVVGFGGFYVWHREHNKTKPAATTTVKSASTKSTSITSNTSRQQYLTIKEWGVKVPMPSTVNVSDIYYVIKTDSTNGNSLTAILGSTQLNAITSSCDLNNGGSTPFGWIEKMTPAAYQAASQDPTDTGVDNGILFDGYYYVWQVPRANCYETAGASDSTIMSKINALTPNNQLVDNFPTDMPTILKSIATST